MKKIFLAALAATTLFASCGKDDTGKANDGNGAETLMGLSLTFPSNSGTRANETTVDEMTVNDIIVFLYGTGGEPAIGNMSSLDLADFTKDGDVYTLKHNKRITTTTGVKSVYVGVNLEGSDFMVGIDENTKEWMLNELYSTSVAKLIAADADGLPSSNFPMFSQVVERPVLVAESDPNWFDNNTISVNVERQVAKMTADVANTLEPWKNASAETLGVHTIKGYYLGQTGKGKMYRCSQFNLAGKRITAPERTGLGYTHHYLPVNSAGTALNATPSLTAGVDKRTSFFGIENVGLNNIRKETTVAVFYTNFVPAKLTKYTESSMINGDPTTAWSDTSWSPITAEFDVDNLDTEANDKRTILPGSFWMVKKGTDYKFFNTQDAALQYVVDFNLAGATQPPITGTTLYQAGNTYFYVYLGDVATSTYEFVRNQYYHLTVSGFNGLGAPGTKDPQDPAPGVDPNDPGTEPKNPSDPTAPIPPGEPTPDVSDPTEPTPGNEDKTTLRVKVVVKAWDVKPMNNITLEE